MGQRIKFLIDCARLMNMIRVYGESFYGHVSPFHAEDNWQSFNSFTEDPYVKLSSAVESYARHLYVFLKEENPVVLLSPSRNVFTSENVHFVRED